MHGMEIMCKLGCSHFKMCCQTKDIWQMNMHMVTDDHTENSVRMQHVKAEWIYSSTEDIAHAANLNNFITTEGKKSWEKILGVWAITDDQ